jgi:ectoine hydroxylase-related dioxygenase (phytanoyl-CoA dioxygenase family)
VHGPTCIVWADVTPCAHALPLQDNAYWKCQQANLMSCWVALDDVTAENGALRMMPGSFATSLEGTAMPNGHREDGDEYRRQHIDPLFDISQAETLAPLAAGSVIFHHCRCLHSSLPNRTSMQRRAFVIHMMAPGTAGADGAVLESSWQRPVLRLRTAPRL